MPTIDIQDGKISVEKQFYKEIKWNGRIYPGGFAGLIENRGHSGVHMFHGQWGQAPMASMRSPDDPLFYLHHAFIDYHWALWQDCNDYDEVASKTLKEGKIFKGFTFCLILDMILILLLFQQNHLNHVINKKNP